MLALAHADANSYSDGHCDSDRNNHSHADDYTNADALPR